MTRLPPGTYPTFARELLAARETLTLPQVVGLALRADRYRLGLSQRCYARRRGWPASRIARLEAAAGRLKLDDVVAALEGTAYVLAVCEREPPDADPDAPTPAAGAALPLPYPTPLPHPTPLPADSWSRSELVARVRDGSRRFPGHRRTEQVTYPPPWWWATEATSGGEAPHWYAPEPSGWDLSLDEVG